MVTAKVFPGNAIEQGHFDEGSVVCGMDEVGRGAWAGPLVIAAVIPGTGTIDGVTDSKKVSQKNREKLDIEIRSWAKGIGIGVVDNNEIDKFGMSKALNICSQRALSNLETNSVKVEIVLLDGHYDFIKQSSFRVQTLVKGDSISHAIAASSIVAKVYRDNYMASREVAAKYEEFCFEKNKGYPAPVHKEALKKYGPTLLHRISWNILDGSFSAIEPDALF